MALTNKLSPPSSSSPPPPQISITILPSLNLKIIMKKRKIFLQFLCVFLFFSFIFYYLFFIQNFNINGFYQPNYIKNYANLPISNIPIIKEGTKFFNSSLFEQLNIKPGISKNCPKQCLFIDEKDKWLKNKVDITLIHARNLEGETLSLINYASRIGALGTKIFYSVESPLYTPIHGFNNDYIFTYHSNNYGLTRRYDKFEPINNLTKANEIWTDDQIYSAINAKTKGLLVLVSNCDTYSSREYLIEAISQYLPVTIYGSCSNIECDSKCEEKAIKEHKFYLAFENSVCNEYVTEKFWRLKKLIVPIVLSKNATTENVAPYENFIAMDEFDSLEEFAVYLTMLMSNLEEYKKFFSWTKLYKKSTATIDIGCNLCKLAWEFRTNSTQAKTMLPTYDQWLTQSQCKLNYALSLMTSEELSKTSFFPLYEKLLFLFIPLTFFIFAILYAYRTSSFHVLKIFTIHYFINNKK